MKKRILKLILFIIFLSYGFAETTEYQGFLDNDNNLDLLIEDKNLFFNRDEDSLDIDIHIYIKLLNNDGSIKKQFDFIDKITLYNDEYDGTLSYSIENNMIKRQLITGRHSDKNYINSFYKYDNYSNNWILIQKTIIKDPIHNGEQIENLEIGNNIPLFNLNTFIGDPNIFIEENTFLKEIKNTEEEKINNPDLIIEEDFDTQTSISSSKLPLIISISILVILTIVFITVIRCKKKHK